MFSLSTGLVSMKKERSTWATVTICEGADRGDRRRFEEFVFASDFVQVHLL